jgi:hypothetical protein
MTDHAPRVRTPRGPARFREKDVVRALKAAMQLDYPAGISIAPDGTISIVKVDPELVRLVPRPAPQAPSNIVHPSQFTTGYIYFVTASELPFVKIGFAGSVRARIAALQIGSPYRLKVLTTFHGNMEDESTLHEILARYRASGEWFHWARPIHELIEYLQARCGDTGAIAPHIRGRKPL